MPGVSIYPDPRYNPYMENEEGFRLPDLRTAFCASFEQYKEECPKEVLGVRARGVIRIEPGQFRDSECFLTIFTPDFSGYRFEKTAFMDGACRCGKGGPVLRSTEHVHHPENYWPYTIIHPDPGKAIVAFPPRRETPGSWRFTVWTPAAPSGYSQVRSLYNMYMFDSTAGFRDFVRYQTDAYRENLERAIAEEEIMIKTATVRAAKFKSYLERLNPDAAADGADLKLSLIGGILG